MNAENTNLIPISLHYLKDLSGGDTAFEIEMLTIYASEVEKDAENLSIALHELHWNNIAQLVHKLKSSVSLVGLEALITTLNDVETAIKTTGTFHDTSVIELLIAQLQLSVTEVNALLAQ